MERMILTMTDEWLYTEKKKKLKKKLIKSIRKTFPAGSPVEWNYKDLIPGMSYW